MARSTILVVDASNSMRGAKFAAATDAVTAFLATAPPDVKIGMVAFAGKVGTTIEPTTDRTALLDEFKGLELAQGTGVYDALAEAVDLAGTEGSRSLLLLSDGADTGSDATLDDVAAAAAEAEVVVDVVSLGSAAKADALATLADETSGRVFPADADALSQVFAEQAEALAQQLLVSFDLPEGVSGEADIAVTVQGAGTTYTDSAFVNVGERTTVDDRPAGDRRRQAAGQHARHAGRRRRAVPRAWSACCGRMLSGGTGRKSSVDKRLDAYFAGGDGSASQGQGWASVRRLRRPSRTPPSR